MVYYDVEVEAGRMCKRSTASKLSAAVYL